MHAADFGSPTEYTVRYAAVFVLGAAIAFFLGIQEILIWLALYAGAELLHYGCTKIGLQSPTRRMARITQLTYFLSASIFVTFPMMLTHSEHVAVITPALVAQIGWILFTLWRPMSIPSIAVFDTSVAIAFCVNACFAFWGLMEDAWAQVVFMLSMATLAIYYAMTIVRNLALQRAMDARRRRAAEAEKMEALGRLVGGVAHDFNNILTVVKGNIELYHVLPPGPDREALLDEVDKAATRAVHLTGQLLSYGRKAALAPSVIPLEEHLHDILPMVERLLPQWITLEVDIPKGLGLVSMDSSQFGAALLNLVSNASDAIGEREGRITLKAWRQEGQDGAPRLRLAVTDTGGGMSTDVAASALEPYFTTKPVGRGSGLGLPMVKGFAEQTGGALDLRNRPGDGLTVTLTLPVEAPQGTPVKDRAEAPLRRAQLPT